MSCGAVFTVLDMFGIRTLLHRSKTGSIRPYALYFSSSRSGRDLSSSSSTSSFNKLKKGPWRPPDTIDGGSRIFTSHWLMNDMSRSHYSSLPICLTMTSHHRSYSSHTDGKSGDVAEKGSDSNSASEQSDWVDFLDQARQSAADAATTAGIKAKELSDAAMKYVQKLYDSQPYLETVIVPVGGTLLGTMLAWVVMPRVLRKLHKYTSERPVMVLLGSSTTEQVPYEYSMWSALEDPAKYLITFLAFSQLGVIIAPSTSVYLPQLWRGAVVLSFLWFLQRWKTNFFRRAMANTAPVGLDREKLLALEKASSLGIIVLGVMALAEACGVAVQSILTVGGVGGVATAFAARDILGNMLSGFSLQFSKPFSVGDNIKAGSIEGQVVEIGLTSTSLISPEKFPLIVPNSHFSSQVIVNKSRAQWRAYTAKIPVRIEDVEKIPLISEEISSTLRSNPKVFLDNDPPYCYLSRLENSFGELTIGCNLKNMRKYELFATEQDILIQAASIIRKHGAELGSTPQCC